MTIATRGFELVSWQASAVDAWVEGSDLGPRTGTIEVVTGGGKTLIAVTCIALTSRDVPGLKVAIVVPTQALARQWRDVLLERTDLEAPEIGLMGAGRDATLQDCRVLIAVLNSASTKLPDMSTEHQPLMLVVDECHRAGAPKFSRVLRTRAAFRLGLSATPDREELDEDGEPIEYDEQVVGRSLGGLVFRFGLKQAREAGWLPEFTLHHHAVSLTGQERSRYEALSRQVDDASDELRSLGGEQARARQLSARDDDLGSAARRWVSLTGQRKDLLYRAVERHRVASQLTLRAFGAEGARQPRVILFHERTTEATALRHEIARLLPGIDIALEHSKLSAKSRVAALADFAGGESPVLVSVKSLIEGIDVPAADTGISVASTASVRQRVQALGRVLRRSTDLEGESKRAEMHLLYVDETVDDLIYAKTDWSDLTGHDANRYWRWSEGAEEPEPLDGPPREPKPTEEAAWAQIRDTTLPAPWPGEAVGQEYSVDTVGVVHNAFDRLISNPQGVGDLVHQVRGEAGGRFRVTPQERIVLVWNVDATGPRLWAAGVLAEPFEVAEERGTEHIDVASLAPGDEYLGPSDKKGGTYKLSQKAGGAIERPIRGGREYADTSSDSDRAANGRTILETWNELGRPTSRIFVNALGHAWFESGGRRLFIADVPAGFAWPEEENDRHE